jgi:hypothetical protein
MVSVPIFPGALAQPRQPVLAVVRVRGDQLVVVVDQVVEVGVAVNNG